MVDPLGADQEEVRLRVEQQQQQQGTLGNVHIQNQTIYGRAY